MKKIILTIGTLLILSKILFANSSGTTMADFLKRSLNCLSLIGFSPKSVAMISQ